MKRGQAVIAVIVFALIILLGFSDATADTVYLEDFGAGATEWEISNGVWQIGTPTAGPAGAYSGSQCGGRCSTEIILPMMIADW